MVYGDRHLEMLVFGKDPITSLGVNLVHTPHAIPKYTIHCLLHLVKRM